MIISEKDRIAILIGAGVSEVFLNALQDAKHDPVLKYLIREPESFYFYSQSNYLNNRFIQDFNIVPIFEEATGDVFYVYIFNDEASKFAHFGLEQDYPYSDYETSFDVMLANLLVKLYEFADDLSIAELGQKGEEMGAKFAKELFLQLEKADENRLRSSFESDRKWRNENLSRIIDGADKL